MRAFPKSGCLYIKSRTGSKNTITSPSVLDDVSFLFPRKLARQKMSKGFKISENWIRNPKKSIHRTAPLLSKPIPSTIISKMIDITYIGRVRLSKFRKSTCEKKRNTAIHTKKKINWLIKNVVLMEKRTTRLKKIRVRTGMSSDQSI